MSQRKPKKLTDVQVVVVKKMRDYSKDPNVRKKSEKAKALIEKYGRPGIGKK